MKYRVVIESVHDYFDECERRYLQHTVKFCSLPMEKETAERVAQDIGGKIEVRSDSEWIPL